MKVLLLMFTTLQGDSASAVTFIREILGSPIGSFTFIMGMMVAAGWLIHYVTKHITKYTTERTEDRRRVDKVDAVIDGIRTDISMIKGSMLLLGGKFNDSPIQSHSPVSLTEFGKQLAAKMDLDARIANNWEKIYSFLETHLQSKNAYDIQQFCIETASVSPERFLRDEDVEFLKTFAYQEGKPLIYYGGVIGVLIRDAYFRHKGIDVSDVDKIDPQKK